VRGSQALALSCGAAALAGCGGGEIVLPLPETVVGPLPQPPPLVKGNPAAGKQVFLKSGCGACHTFKPAGTRGTVGPDLDNLATYAQKANQPLREFVRTAITNPPPPYVPPGFPTNVMPTTYGQSLTARQLADLVAFLTQRRG
jgi:mono/diheme cytochrome c family protein